MKLLLLFFALSLFSSSIFAQLNKGQWLIGGSAGFYYIKQKYSQNPTFQNYEQTSAQISPTAGYFIIDRLCAGIRTIVNFTHSKSNDSTFNATESYASNSNAFSIAPFVRYYFLPKTNKVNLLADVSYLYSFGKTKNWYNDVYNGFTKQHWYSYTIAAGPVFFFNPKSAIEVTAGYTFENQKIYYSKTNTLMLSAGFQVYLGK